MDREARTEFKPTNYLATPTMRYLLHVIAAVALLAAGGTLWDRCVSDPRIAELKDQLQEAALHSAHSAAEARIFEHDAKQARQRADESEAREKAVRAAKDAEILSVRRESEILRRQVSERELQLAEALEPIPTYTDPELAHEIASQLQSTYRLEQRPTVYPDLRLSREAAELSLRAAIEAESLRGDREDLSGIVLAREDEIERLGEIRESLNRELAVTRDSAAAAMVSAEKWRLAWEDRGTELEISGRLIREYERQRGFRWLPRLGCAVGPTVSERGASVVGVSCGASWSF